MADMTGLTPEAAFGSQLTTVDRRRPGRVQNVSPELLPLLRKPVPDAAEVEALLLEPSADPQAAPELGIDVDNPLAPARGLLAAVALSVPMWLIIVGIFYLMA